MSLAIGNFCKSKSSKTITAFIAIGLTLSSIHPVSATTYNTETVTTSNSITVSDYSTVLNEFDNLETSAKAIFLNGYDDGIQVINSKATLLKNIVFLKAEKISITNFNNNTSEEFSLKFTKVGGEIAKLNLGFGLKSPYLNFQNSFNPFFVNMKKPLISKRVNTFQFDVMINLSTYFDQLNKTYSTSDLSTSKILKSLKSIDPQKSKGISVVKVGDTVFLKKTVKVSVKRR